MRRPPAVPVPPPTPLRWLAVLGLLIALMPGCTFDPSALDARLCGPDQSCPLGTCVGGICVPDEAAGADDVGADRDANDLSPDTGAPGACRQPEPLCEGVVQITCRAGTEVRTPCTDPAVCSGALGCTCAGGACLPRICSPGQGRCIGEVPETCVGDGVEFEAGDACSPAELCAEGACLPRRCEAGTVRCVDNRIVRCGRDGQVAAAQDCGGQNAWCDDSGPSPLCRPRVCEPGQVTCVGSVVSQCDLQGANQVPLQECAPAQWCLDGACSDRVCNAGRTRCLDSATIGRCDTTGLNEVTEPCPEGQYCASGGGGAVCIPQVCAPESLRCGPDGEAVQRCAPDGSAWLAPVGCQAGNLCRSGVCEPWVCTPGSSVCLGDGRTRRLCGDRGDTQRDEPCSSSQYCDDASGSARCLAQVCTPGQVRCLDLSRREVCNDRGSAWNTLAVCSAEQSCVAGVCELRVCTPNAARCVDGSTRATCNATGTVESPQGCGTNAFCSEGFCRTRVCTPGQITCVGTTARRICDELGSGTTDVACAGDQVCEAGACVARICAAGQRTCSGPATVRTCNATGSAFTESTCGAGSVCDAGQCVTRICEPGSRSCASATSPQVCNDSGTAQVLQAACATSQACVQGVCLARICEPGARTCVNGQTEAVCNATGTAFNNSACAAGQSCFDNQCRTRICTPGSATCESTTSLRTCNSEGSGFVTSTCAAGSTCLGDRCQLVICTPDSVTCLDSRQLSTCNATGTASSVTSCGANEVCVGTACQPRICSPDAVRCDGVRVVRCNGTGTAETLVETCPDACEAGACAGSLCGNGRIDAGETCDDGNNDPCDGCDRCERNQVATIQAGTARTGGGTWQPGTSVFTLEMWTRVTGAGLLGGIAGAVDDDYGVLGVDSEGRPFMEMKLVPSAVFRVTGDRSILDGAWHHIAGSRVDNAGLALWVDGILAGYAPASSSANSLDSNLIFVGTRAGVTNGGATARIDEFRISTAVYPGSFTPQRRMTAQASTIGLWRFDGPANQTVPDAAGSRNLSLSNTGRAADTCFDRPGSYLCGDSARAPWERCDDGNVASGDGCSSTCQRECGADLTGPAGECLTFRSNSTNWQAHLTACRQAGGTLATIRSLAHNNWIRDRLNLPNNSFWIGLNDLDDEGAFVWTSGDPSPFRNWNGGEPNNQGDEDCALYLRTGGQWNDAQCGSNNRALCER
jgi:cysteine-rich repeat protein